MLYAGGVVTSVVVAQFEGGCAGGSRCVARQQSIREGVLVGRADGIGQTHYLPTRFPHPVELVPLPVEPGAVGVGEQFPTSSGDAVGENGLGLARVHAVESGTEVAAQRSGRKVGIRQAEVGFVADFGDVGEFEGKRLVQGGPRRRVPLHLQHPVGFAEAGGSAAVEFFEPVGAGIEYLGEHGQDPCPRRDRCAGDGMEQLESVRSAFGVDAGDCAGVGGRRGDEVDCTPSGDGSEGDLARPLQHLNAGHARHRRKVIRCWRRVRRRCNRDPVLQHGDARRPVAARSADADVRAQAESVLFDQLHARHRPQGSERIRIGKALQFGGRQHVQAPGYLVCRRCSRGHPDCRHLRLGQRVPQGLHRGRKGISWGDRSEDKRQEEEHGAKVPQRMGVGQFPVWGILGGARGPNRQQRAYLAPLWKFH